MDKPDSTREPRDDRHFFCVIRGIRSTSSRGLEIGGWNSSRGMRYSESRGCSPFRKIRGHHHHESIMPDMSFPDLGDLRRQLRAHLESLRAACVEWSPLGQPLTMGAPAEVAESASPLSVGV